MAPVGQGPRAAIAGVVLALTLSVTAARAQAPPPSPSALVDEVQVIARLPGPALWRVSTPTSQLWILGLAGPLPKRLDWDSRRVQTALAGARELVLPPGASLGVGDMVGLMLDRGHVLHLPRGQTLRAGLSEPLRTRFEAAARMVGQDPAHYDHWRPVFASIALVFDASKREGLDPPGPQRAVADLARREHVPVRRLADYRAGALLKSWSQISPDAAQACLTLAVSMVERLPADAPAMAQAWARGDVGTVNAIDAATSPDSCFSGAPAVAELQARVAKDWAEDLAQALSRPGKTVAAVDMGGLTRPGGLLDQLKAQGFDVVGPAY